MIKYIYHTSTFTFSLFTEACFLLNPLCSKITYLPPHLWKFPGCSSPVIFPRSGCPRFYIFWSGLQMVWIETPTNPLLKLADIKALSAIAHERKDVIVVVDNTFMSSYFQVTLSCSNNCTWCVLNLYWILIYNCQSSTCLPLGYRMNGKFSDCFHNFKYFSRIAGGEHQCKVHLCFALDFALDFLEHHWV